LSAAILERISDYERMENDGRLSGRARESEFSALTDEETERIEAAYAELFGSDHGPRE